MNFNFYEKFLLITPQLLLYLRLNQILNNIQAFSVSSKYISDLIAGLNLILVTAISASVPNPAPISTFNITALPSSLTEYYNASWAIPTFSVIVKPAFIKYLEETRKKSIKHVLQDKYNDFVSQLANPDRKAYIQAERNAKSKANLWWFIREDVYPELQGLQRRPLGANEKALKVIPEPEIYDIIISKYIKHSGQKKTYYIIIIEYYSIKSVEVD